MIKVAEIRQKTEAELLEQLKTLRKELKDKSQAVINRQEKNVKSPRNLRKDIARVLGILKEKAILKEANA